MGQINFSGCEIIEMGIQIEKNGRDFYKTLAEASDSPEAKEVFEYLAKEEEGHIDVFQKLSEGLCDYEPKEVYTDEYFAYLRALAEQYVFTQKDKGKKIAEKVKTSQEGLELGIQFEKDSILVFEEMKKFVSEKNRGLVDKLIAEEKKHLSRLSEIKEIVQ